MRGRRPKPTELKRLDGNPGKRALNDAEPRPRVVLPRPPAHLSDDEKAKWKSLVKDALILSRKDYHTQYEPMWYGWDNRAPCLVKVDDRKISDVWLINRPKKSEEHPTMKPLELVERSLANSSHVGDIVLDLFAGSGTTLLACERLGRVCRTMDNDQKYIAVCLERWSVATGKQPERITA